MAKFILCLFLICLGLSSVQACSDGCYDCDKTTNTCIACSDGFERTAQGNCIPPTIDNCILYGSSNQCYKCRPTFKPSANLCVKQYSGCVRYSTTNKCLECGFGLQLNNDTCVGILNCNKADSSNVCTQCNNGYTLSNNICKSSMPNCTDVDPKTGACKNCSEGNLLSGYVCVSAYIDPQFCYVYDANGQCLYCKEGFTSLEGVCYTSGEIQKIYAGQNVRARRILKVSSSPNSGSVSLPSAINATSSSSNSSSQLASNSSTPQNNTQTKKPANPIDRCSRYDETLTKCLMCQNLYILVNETCYFAIEGCSSYQVSGKSLLCKECTEKYELEPKTSICLLKQEDAVKDCFIPSLNKLSCIVCNQGFVEKNGQCISQTTVDVTQPEKKNCASYDDSAKKCKTCTSTNFKLENGLCLDINCDRFNSSAVNQCVQCKQYFQLNSTKGICEYKDSNCDKVLDQKCSQCAKGYFITDAGYCALIPYGCEIPNPKTAQCSICQSKFMLLSNGTCRQQLAIQNCQTLETNQNAINKCAACIDGFYPSFDSCKKVSSRCNGYDKDTGYCIGCVAPFTLNKGKCLDVNCMMESALVIDSCDLCKDGFVFKNGMCRFDDVNCQVVQNDGCSLCKEGYSYVTARNKCMPSEQTKNTSGNQQSNSSSGQISSSQQNQTSSSQLNQTSTASSNEQGSQVSNSSNSVSNFSQTPSQSNVSNSSSSSSQSAAQNQSSKPLVSTTESTTNKSQATNNTQATTSTINTTTSQSAFQNQSNSSTSTLPTTTNSSYSSNSSSSTNSSIPSTPKPSMTNNSLPLTNSTSATNQTATTTNNKIENCVYQNPINPKICLECQKDYILSPDYSTCKSTNPLPSNPVQKDPNCQIPTNSTCKKCNDRFYLSNIINKCTEVNQLCNTYDNSTGACLSCFEGFQVDAGKCSLKIQIDPYCIQRAPQGCSKCIDGYFIDKTKGNTCKKLASFCSSWNSDTGKCLICNDGYSLQNGQCINMAKDPNCLTFSSNTPTACQQCIQNYFMNSMTSKCQKINQNCKTFNGTTGQCYTCKDGFKLSRGLCQKTVSLQNYIKDYFCKTVEKNVCTECYVGYYLSLENVCKQKNPICKEINRDNGDCTKCYDGYYLVSGACVLPSNLRANTLSFNKNCKNFTSTQVDSCTECYPGYRLAGGVCFETNPLCKTFEAKTGVCTSCYDGYYLQAGNCLINLANNPNELDPYCTELSKDFTFCVKCAPGYFVSNDGSCQPFNTSYQCETYTTDGKCGTCPFGYVMTKQKTCIQQVQYCTQYNDQSTCVQCATGFYVKENQCFPNDIKCQIYDPKSGSCNKCVAGFILFDSQCIYPTFGIDKFCTKYVNSYCTQCAQGSYLFNYRCRQVDANCSKFDYDNKKCLECKNKLKPRGISCVSEN